MRVIVCGANGAMGQLILAALGNEAAGKVSLDGENGVPKTFAELGKCDADVIIDFSTAKKYGGTCNLRLDDTNPQKEDTEYIDAIKEDINWLGYNWDKFFYASEYFDKMYEFAVELIKKGLAYVCELTPEQVREYRGDLTTPAQSPYRDRPIEESLDLFKRM